MTNTFLSDQFFKFANSGSLIMRIHFVGDEKQCWYAGVDHIRDLRSHVHSPFLGLVLRLAHSTIYSSASTTCDMCTLGAIILS